MTEAHALFVSGLRTPFTTAHRGALKDTRPDDLLVALIAASRRANGSLWQTPPDDILVGCAYPEGEQGYNIARTAALGARVAAPGVTLNRLCGSSLDAAAVAASFVRSGRGTKFLVGGVESMSRVPRRGAHFSPSDAITRADPSTYVTMGETAEAVAAAFPDIDRLQQEDFAAASHEKTHHAYAKGFLGQHIHSGLPGIPARDEGVRFPVNREKMRALTPAFAENGVVTAATSSPMSDGAALAYVLAESEAKKWGFKNGLRILGAATSHVAPELMGLGPIDAVRRLLTRHELTPSDIDAWEMNEAFAVQVLACQQQLEIPTDRLNSWGGALAIGHPLGASGLRLLMTLQARLQYCGRRGAFGVACACIGGGQGIALLGEFVEWT